MSRMPRTHRPLLATVAVAAVALAGCSTVEDAQQAAGDAIDRVEYCVAAVRIVDAVQGQDLEAAISAGEDLVANAPDDVAADAQVVLDAARQAQAGDAAALDAEAVTAAADRLQASVREDCDPR